MTIMTREISNHDDVIDSREVIERLAELAELTTAEIVGRDLRDEMAEERALKALAEQGEGVEDWQYGATLIRDSYFVEYAQELADDLGMIPEGGSWPAYCIDWTWAARELQMDYTPVEFDGVTYWVR